MCDEKTHPRARRVGSVLGLGAILVATLAGCAHRPPPLPWWAIHVPRPSADPAGDTDARERVIAELGAAGLAAKHVSPERIAALAEAALRDNRPLEAALLLAVASYRYHEEAVLAADTGIAQGRNHMANRPRQAVDAYAEHVRNEIVTYNSLDFDPEADAAVAVWERRSPTLERLSQRLATISGPGVNRSDAERADVAARIEQARTPATTELPDARLLAAFQARLVRHLSDDENHSNFAESYLSHTPFPPLLAAALGATHMYFNAALCRSVAERMSSFRDELDAALAATRPQIRSNAVMAIAIYGDAEQTALLEPRLAAEEDPGVRLALHYALHRAGREGHFAEIDAALTSCATPELCDAAIMMLEWLPEEDLLRVDPERILSVFRNTARTSLSRQFALVLLREYGRKKELPKTAIDTLIAASDTDDVHLAALATEALATAISLDRARVYDLLSRRPRGQHALFFRLAKVATADDLPAIRRWFGAVDSMSDQTRAAFVALVGATPGAEAERLLADLVRRRRDVRFLAAAALGRRDDLDPALAAALYDEGHGAASALLGFVAKAPDAAARTGALLRGSDFEEKAHAATLARLALDDALRGDLGIAAATVDDGYYPADAAVRNEALRGLLALALRQAYRAAAAVGARQEPATPRTQAP
jgi:hypothetical protein